MMNQLPRRESPQQLGEEDLGHEDVPTLSRGTAAQKWDTEILPAVPQGPQPCVNLAWGIREQAVQLRSKDPRVSCLLPEADTCYPPPHLYPHTPFTHAAHEHTHTQHCSLAHMWYPPTHIHTHPTEHIHSRAHAVLSYTSHLPT